MSTDGLRWVCVPCPLCGADDAKELLVAPTDHGDARLTRCRPCGMVYLNPRPDESCLGLLYPDDYEEYQPHQQQPGARQRLIARLRRLALARYHDYPGKPRRFHEKALAAVGKWLLWSQGDSMTQVPYVGQGRMLDVGCGNGWLAARMQQLGWDVTAMDFSAASLSNVRQRYGLPVLAGCLPHQQVPAESYDLITLGCVLEHLPRPADTIRAAFEALRPSGLLVICVPSISSWSFRTFGPDWWGLQLPLHLLHFTPKTLRRLMETSGLEVVELSMVARRGWLRRTVTTTLRRADLSFWRRVGLNLLKCGPISRLVARWVAATRQGECLKVIARKPPVAQVVPRMAA